MLSFHADIRQGGGMPTYGESCRRECEQPVAREMPGCGHNITIRCHESTNDIRCSHPCDRLLPCGHSCRKPCWGVDRLMITVLATSCGRLFTTCSHTCSQPCHSSTPCSPCNRPVKCVADIADAPRRVAIRVPLARRNVDGIVVTGAIAAVCVRGPM